MKKANKVKKVKKADLKKIKGGVARANLSTEGAPGRSRARDYK